MPHAITPPAAESACGGFYDPLTSTSHSDGITQPTTSSKAVHTSFTPINIHTAKCDLCNHHNTSVLQRCSRCSRQICMVCMYANDGDGTHWLPQTDPTWIPDKTAAARKYQGDTAAVKKVPSQRKRRVAISDPNLRKNKKKLARKAARSIAEQTDQTAQVILPDLENTEAETPRGNGSSELFVPQDDELLEEDFPLPTMRSSGHRSLPHDKGKDKAADSEPMAGPHSSPSVSGIISTEPAASVSYNPFNNNSSYAIDPRYSAYWGGAQPSYSWWHPQQPSRTQHFSPYQPGDQTLNGRNHMITHNPNNFQDGPARNYYGHYNMAPPSSSSWRGERPVGEHEQYFDTHSQPQHLTIHNLNGQSQSCQSSQAPQVSQHQSSPSAAITQQQSASLDFQDNYFTTPSRAATRGEQAIVDMVLQGNLAGAEDMIRAARALELIGAVDSESAGNHDQAHET